MAAVMKLTDAERDFAEKHHGLLYQFMSDYRLDEEYYGALAIRYLKTVMQYLRIPKLRQYAFSTILWYRLRSERNGIWKKEQKRFTCIPFEEACTMSFPTGSHEVIHLWDALEKNLTFKQMEALRLRYQGYTCAEIAVKCGITVSGAASRFFRMRKKVLRILQEEI